MYRKTLAALAACLLLGACHGTGSLGGSSWNAVEVITTARPDLADMDVSFGHNGRVTTTIYNGDGSTEISERDYHVYRSLLVVERPEGDLELLHWYDDGELVLTDEDFQARFRRTH